MPRHPHPLSCIISFNYPLSTRSLRGIRYSCAQAIDHPLTFHGNVNRTRDPQSAVLSQGMSAAAPQLQTLGDPPRCNQPTTAVSDAATYILLLTYFHSIAS